MRHSGHPYIVGASMKFFQIVASAIIAGSFGIAGLQAQTKGTTAAPAEFPPTTFTGKQYVDSQGCVFIRAGVSGNVTWIPRVGRDRKQICGIQPSAESVTTAESPAPRAAAKPPVEITLDTSPSVETGSVVAPALVKPVAVSSKPPKAVASASAAPKLTRRSKPAVMKVVPSNVILASANSNRSKGRYTQVRSGQTGEVVLIPRGTRVVPRHVFESHRAARRLKVPRGYSAVWQDDRLNPRRAVQTLEGHAQMNLIWTKTVPRRLIDSTTGNDMTDTLPVVYPFTDIAAQQRAIAFSSKSTSRAKSRATVNPTVSTRSQATQPAAQVKGETLAGRNYVQVGTFDSARSAQASAQRIKKLGLPVRIGKFDRDGKTYRLVLAGPFSSQEQATSALGKAHSAGFSDAFTRN